MEIGIEYRHSSKDDGNDEQPLDERAPAVSVCFVIGYSPAVTLAPTEISIKSVSGLPMSPSRWVSVSSRHSSTGPLGALPDPPNRTSCHLSFPRSKYI